MTSELVGGRWPAVGLLAVSSTLSGVAEAGILAISAQVAASLATGEHRVSASLGPVHLDTSVPTLLLIGLGLAVVRLCLQVPTSYIPARVAASVQTGLRDRLFKAFSSASWKEQASDREGYFQELMTSQVVQAGWGTTQAMSCITGIVAFIVLLASALALNPEAAGILLFASFVLLGMLRPLSAAGSRYAHRYAASQLDYAESVSESSRLAEETRVFGVADAQRMRISGLVSATGVLFFRSQLFTRVIPALYQSVIYLLLLGGLATVYEFRHGSVASLGGVVLLLVRAGTYGNQVQSSSQFVRQALPFFERLREAENRYRTSAPPAGTRQLEQIESLTFEHVEFSYVPNRPVLVDLSFEIRRGEAIGIVGPSGAGKSSLAQLVLELREPTSGRYLVNGLPAADFREEDWHARVSYVPQTPHIIQATVADNIRYFRDLGIGDVEHAARVARIHDDIVEWPLGYDTPIGPRADAVSGGQAQRICLARALVGDPEIILLDEPTSALDPRSEQLIQESLAALKGTVTLLLIAHRVSTLDMCDRVMVLVDGKLDAFETFADLQANNAYYRSARALAGTP